jgi:hypothetical protein
VYVFAGPTTTVVTTAPQRLVGAAEAPLGLSAGADQSFEYGLCYQDSTNIAAPINNFVGGGFSIGVVTTQRQTYAATATVVPGAGSWKVGFCVHNNNAGTISNNDFVNGWVMVTN